MGESDAKHLLERLHRDGVIRDPRATLTPLPGGISSEIYRVTDGAQNFVVKRALAKLRVPEEWLADVGRNHFEQLYFSYVNKILPGAAPAVRTASKEHGYFAMEYLGPEFANWKQLLIEPAAETAHAKLAGQVLGTIHHHSAGDSAAARDFNTTANFHQLRVDPYLLHTAEKHPRLRRTIEAEAQRLESTHLCLVHGDFSPKNILIKDSRLVLLDAEVAWYGDPAFDAAFLLNHLFLKAQSHHAPRDAGFDRMVNAFWGAYATACQAAFDFEELEERVVRLLLLLMLARVDGKSPVEYLAKDRQNVVRDFVKRKLPDKRFKLALIAAAWFAILKELQ